MVNLEVKTVVVGRPSRFKINRIIFDLKRFPDFGYCSMVVEKLLEKMSSSHMTLPYGIDQTGWS